MNVNRTTLTQDDIKVLTNPFAGTRLGWKEKNVPFPVPQPTENPPEAILTTYIFSLISMREMKCYYFVENVVKRGPKWKNAW